MFDTTATITTTGTSTAITSPNITTNTTGIATNTIAINPSVSVYEYTTSDYHYHYQNKFCIKPSDKQKTPSVKKSKVKKSEPPCPYDFEYIKELVPEKVYEFTFYDKTKIKTIREENDVFDLEYAFQIALAKKLYSKDYTFEGILFKACQLQLEKKYAKAIKKGMKLFNTLQKEEQKKKEYDETKKRQHERYVKRKKAAKERKRKDQVNIIAEAIRLSKEGE